MKWFFSLLFFITLAGCKSRNVPDVSSIIIDLEVQRFEKDLFASDTIHIDMILPLLSKKYPRFLQDFVYNIMALPHHPDSMKVVEANIASFIGSYRSMKDTSDMVFASFDLVQKEVKTGMQFIKYYFPDYKLPSKLITFIGPLNSYGNVVTSDALAVGLQMYMGSNYSYYRTMAFQEMYPAYISRRFSKEYIPVNCIKSLVDDIYPDNNVGLNLIGQMVEAGKRLYILDQLMPETADTLKIGYSKQQLEGCFENERTIWSFFVKNDLLFSTDPGTTRDYMNDAPITQAFGKESPGAIGQFVGWQIVKKWMDKHEKTTLAALINTDSKTIFEEAKYKP